MILIVVFKDNAFLGTSAQESVPTAGSLPATCRLPVGYSRFPVVCRTQKDTRQTLAGSSEIALGRARANLGTTWIVCSNQKLCIPTSLGPRKCASCQIPAGYLWFPVVSRTQRDTRQTLAGSSEIALGRARANLGPTWIACSNQKLCIPTSLCPRTCAPRRIPTGYPPATCRILVVSRDVAKR